MFLLGNRHYEHFTKQHVINISSGLNLLWIWMRKRLVASEESARIRPSVLSMGHVTLLKPNMSQISEHHRTGLSSIHSLRLKPEWQSGNFDQKICDSISPLCCQLTSPRTNVCAFGIVVLNSRDPPCMFMMRFWLSWVVWGCWVIAGTQKNIDNYSKQVIDHINLTQASSR